MLIGRLFRLLFRRPGASLAALVAAGLWGGVAVNALVLQDGPHPAPLIGRADHGPPSAIADRAAELEDAERQKAQQEHRALVREIQELLAERGFYDGAVDGLHGPVTADAIRAFEAAAGMDQIGEPRAVLLAQIELSGVEAPRQSAPEEPGDSQPATAEAEPAESVTAETEPVTGIGDLLDEAPDAHDFAETGLPGMSTLTEADTALEPPGMPEQAAAAPAGDPQIVAVQRVLADLGYAPGRIDGQLGPQTEDAIRRFQQDRGLAPTGNLDNALLRELSAVSGESLG